MVWRVEIERGAAKAIRALPKSVQARVTLAIDELAKDPLNGRNVKALIGRGGYRLRVGDYRVVYDLEHDVLVISVIAVAHRREVYR